MAAHANPSFRMPARIAASDLLSDRDVSREELVALLALAEKVKAQPARYASALSGRYLSLLFEKPSLRTRMTFELAIKQLGGDAVSSAGPIGDREPIKDIARNLDRWTNGIVARTFSQQTIEQLAHWSRVPVINALSDKFHPCQAFADMFTLQEHWGDLAGRKLVFAGDGNNMAHSLMLCAARLGMDFALALPRGYEPDAAIVSEAKHLAASSGATLEITHDAAQAVAGADAVYTDVWASMGQESEREKRLADFSPVQVNEALMSKARPGGLVMHSLPARRGEEVTDAVIESAQSVVFEQAENRLHVQKALLLMLL